MMADERLVTAAGEFTRFVMVGMVSNTVLFLLYLLITWFGVGHKLAATLIYVLGVLQTFAFNRSWSFRHQGAAVPALGRYIGAYAAGYALNMAALAVFVDAGGYPHQWVQAVMIIVLAVLLFVAQKLWVFRQTGEAP